MLSYKLSYAFVILMAQITLKTETTSEGIGHHQSGWFFFCIII